MTFSAAISKSSTPNISEPLTPAVATAITVYTGVHTDAVSPPRVTMVTTAIAGIDVISEPVTAPTATYAVVTITALSSAISDH